MNAIAERWIGGCRRELLDRTLVWNQAHLRRILRQYETHHNQHRSHRSLKSAAPLKPLPEPVDLEQHRIRRHPQVGGIINEYRLVALHGRPSRHPQVHPHRPGEQPGQRGDHHPVGPAQPGFRVLPPQHRDFLAQHQEFGVLRGRRAGEQHQPADQADEHQIEHPYCHKLAMLPVTGPLPQANRRSAAYAPFWNPTGDRADLRRHGIQLRNPDSVAQSPGSVAAAPGIRSGHRCAAAPAP